MQWRKIALIGVGLLGGSLGLAVRRRGLAVQVAGYVRRPEAVAECRRLQTVDMATTDLLEAAADADLIVFCTPIAQMAALTNQLLPAIRPGTVVTDVGSVKAAVVHELEPLLAGVRAGFVGSHPMAGAEKSGMTAARPDLFCDSVCVVTPTDRSDPEAVRRVEGFWESIGARPVRLSAELHDELVCRSSHLPHVTAAALVNLALDPGLPPEQSLVCANGFRDTTRVASGSPEMWRDIALANRGNLAQSVEVLVRGLKEFQGALETGDSAVVEAFFRTAKQRRDNWRSTQTHAAS